MKRLFTILLLVSVQWVIAQIPTGYYSTATGTGYTLKTQLHNIIKDHTVLTYTPGLWNLYSSGTAWKDNWYENDGTILDMYSEKPSGTDSYEFTPITDQCGSYGGEGDCYNREHIIPQSVFNSNSPMVSDAFHIWPTDGYVNGKRSNYPYGKVGSASWTSTNGSKLGTNLDSGYSAGYTATVFEPIDEFKGDIARAYFYFATRYESEGVATWTYEMFNGTNNQVIAQPFLNILLTWHNQDPVSARELAINESIYAEQHNRNPFIDHPEWVTTIWGSPAAVDELNSISLEIYPNPVSDRIYLKYDDTVKINEYHIVSLLGKLVQKGELTDNQIDVTSIPQGMYFLTLFSEKGYVAEKIIIN